MLVALKQGESLFLYPEGTRNRTGQPLKEFKDGAFRAAILAQVPIVVQTLVNPRELNNPDGIHLQPGRLDLHFSAPIDTRGMSLEDVPRLKQQVIDEMMRHLVH
jgi:1-acyl-sn-glycerol-3-phosphate acyltransferase